MKPKGKNAFERQKSVIKSFGEIKKHLDTAYKSLYDILYILNKDDPEVIITSPWKKRSMINDIPPRLEFEYCNLRMYIDFTIVDFGSDDESIINGCIVYGVNRTLCFFDPKKVKAMEILQDKKKSNKDPDCEHCQRIGRCDNLEDKPLIDLIVNNQGLIESHGDLDGEWWVGTVEESDEVKRNTGIKEMNYRVLNHIWKDALNWTNENILP